MQGNYKDLLTGSECISTTRIREFLKHSREISDDKIKEHLNETGVDNCSTFFDEVILKNWKERAALITYCEKTWIGIKNDAQKNAEILSYESNIDEFNLREDPYAKINYEERYRKQFEQVEYLKNWISNEKQIEKIVQEHSVDVLREKCSYHDWINKFREYTKQ